MCVCVCVCVANIANENRAIMVACEICRNFHCSKSLHWDINVEMKGTKITKSAGYLVKKFTAYACTHKRVCMCVYQIPMPQVNCNTFSFFLLFFKPSIMGLCSEFSFSKMGCHTKAKEPRLYTTF